MNPAAVEAIRIADKHLAGESVERRKALAHEIVRAITKEAERIATEALKAAAVITRIKCKQCGSEETIQGPPRGNCTDCGHPRFDGMNWGFDIITSAEKYLS